LKFTKAASCQSSNSHCLSNDSNLHPGVASSNLLVVSPIYFGPFNVATSLTYDEDEDVPYMQGLLLENADMPVASAPVLSNILDPCPDHQGFTDFNKPHFDRRNVKDECDRQVY
jgi:hypothetical protein